MLRVAADGTSSVIGAQLTKELIELQKRLRMAPGDYITCSYSGIPSTSRAGQSSTAPVPRRAMG